MKLTDQEAINLRRRLKNQKRELRKLNKYIVQQVTQIQLAYSRADRASKLYHEVLHKRYRTKMYRFYQWWRNRVVWRVGQLLPGVRQHWTARSWYNKGVEDALRCYGIPSGRKFPEGE